MFLFDLIFGKKDHGEKAAQATATKAEPQSVAPSSTEPAVQAPGTIISYDPHLIEGLYADHGKLLDNHGAMMAALELGDLTKVEEQLRHFRTLLMDHLLRENVRLYIYLEHLLESDPISHEMMHGFRREMDTIGRVVVAFLSKYQNLASQPKLVPDFRRDVAGIGEALVARISREEETLYPMYQAPGK